MMSQYLTEGILRKHLATFGVRVELSTEPSSIEQDASGVSVTLKKTDDKGGETYETIRAGYVFGADGARGESTLDITVGRDRLTLT